MQLEELELLLGDPASSDGVLDAGSPKGSLAWTPLQFACALGDEALVSVLLQKQSGGLAVGKARRTKYDYAPLHVAVRFGHAGVVRLLLADPHLDTVRATDSHIGASALHLAVLGGSLELVRLLLEADAKHTPTKNGTTPLQVAKALGHVEISQLLTDHIAKAAGKELIGNWLASIGMVEYAPNFHDAGFDDAAFLLANGMSESVLDEMQVRKPGHRAKLLSLYQLKEALPSLAGSESDKVEDDDEDEEEDEESGSSDSTSGSGSEDESDGDEGEDTSSDDDSGGGSGSE